MYPPIHIPATELDFTYSRSSGPGGQNVNKVNSKVLLRWNVLNSNAFGFEAKAKLIANLGSQLTKEGDLLITSQRFRDQPKNQAECLKKLQNLLALALKPTKVRKTTKPTKGSHERRLKAKKQASQRRQQRRIERD